MTATFNVGDNVENVINVGDGASEPPQPEQGSGI